MGSTALAALTVAPPGSSPVTQSSPPEVGPKLTCASRVWVPATLTFTG